MATYLTDTDLRARSVQFSESQRGLKSYRSAYHTSVFLSHSHHDKDLVEGLVDYLAQQGVDVYVDWKDATLPSSPTRDTVNRIKQQIEQNDVFVLLATDRALNSKWVPWELGVADKAKGYDRIAVVPVTRNGTFQGNEYVQIYRQIKKEGFSALKAFGAGGTGLGTSARSFLSKSPVLG